MDLAEFPLHFLATFPDVVGQRVLVALSGGPDSVALLHLLGHPDLGLELEAVHVHHGIRGEEADADAVFCEELCLELTIPFHLHRISAGQPMPAGREGTWRELRYRALFNFREERTAAAVAKARRTTRRPNVYSRSAGCFETATSRGSWHWF